MPGGQKDDLQRQVAAAQEAVGRQELAQRSGSPQRLKGLAAMFVALGALAATLWVGGQRLAPPQPDADLVLQATIEGIDAARVAVERYRDSTGTLPAALDDVGYGDLPFTYSRTGDSFRIAALSPQGDSVGYQSPPLGVAGGSR